MNSNDKPAPIRSFGIISVSLDESASYQAYSCGEVWNGYQCPYFTLEEAKKLSEDPCIRGLEYEPENDRFVLDEPEYADDPAYEPDTFDAVTINVDGQAIKTYAIGAYLWCWYKD